MNFFSFEQKDLGLMPERKARSNKGDFGRLLCVCGSVGMSGAAYFAAKAAYRMGVGLVEILTEEQNRAVLQTLIPEAIVSTWSAENYDKNAVLRVLERADAVVVGCGLSQNVDSRGLLSDILRNKKEGVPLLIDADGLNLLAKNPSLMKYARGAVITPHFGEMSRLCGKSIEEISENVAATAHDFAAKHELVCVLKDHRTVVSDGGESVYLNKRGNSGMASGGSGDVLAGVIGGVLCQAAKGERREISTLEYAALGVYIHSVAGDIAADRLSEYSVMASDIIDCLPIVMKRI